MNFQPPGARDLFLQASALDSDEARARLLDEACAADEVLRQEVEGLLAEQARLGDFLESPALKDETLANGRNHAPREADREKIDAIGPYKLLQEIGEGGGGVVYMAEQEHPVRRRVALKVIKLGMDTKSVIARFESERQALAMMDHPNIAKVLDAGTTERGRPYFVMELVRGIRITDYCDQHKLTTKGRLKLFAQVSQAIQHAHQKGIIHRDIKPSNILVTLHDSNPVPKIIDFGIAKATEQRLTDKTLFTEYQSFIGTPAYMSPEQAEMSGLDIDTRSDIYSLGVLLYELLVGKTPFDATELRESGLDACRQTIREVEPERPSLRVSTMVDADRTTTAHCRQLEPGRLAYDLRGDLDWIVMKCLEKDRQRRYATANALASDVQHYLAGDLVSARPPSALYRLQKSINRHRVAVTATAMVVLTLTAAAFLSTWQALRATKAKNEASQARAEQQTLREIAERDREMAVTNEARARINEYVAEMNVAYQALRDGNLGRAFQLVEKHRNTGDRRDLRGFEWRYLRRLCEGDAHLSFPNLGTAIRVLTFSPDGDLLAVGGREEELQLWDVATRSQVIQLPVAARALAFSPDGQTLYTAGFSGVQAWDTTTWIPRAGPDGFTRGLALSPDGTQLLVGSRNRVQLLDAASFAVLWENTECSEPVVFSHDGALVASDSEHGLRIFRADDGHPLVTMQDSRNLVSHSILFSPDDATLISPRNGASSKGTFVLSLWNAATGEEIGTLPKDPHETDGHTGDIAAIRLSPDGNTLATASLDHSIGLWNLADRTPVALLRGHQHEVWGLDFSPKEGLLAAGGKDGSIFLWQNQAPDRRDVIRGLGVNVGLSKDGRQLACADKESSTLHIVDLRTHATVKTLSLEPFRQNRFGPQVFLNRDFTVAVQIADDGRYHLIDLTTGASSVLALGDDASAIRLTLSPDGQQLIAQHHREMATWWSLGESSPTLVKEISETSFSTFSGDGATLITLGLNDKVRVWDTTTATETNTFTARAGGTGLALSIDGMILATSGNQYDSENSIFLWSTETGTALEELDGHKQAVVSLAFSDDGNTLASSSQDSTLKLWHLPTSQELVSIRKLGTILRDLRFSQDGQWLVANSGGAFLPESEVHLFHAPRSQQ